MKTKKWIIIIGVACILFGITGILSNIIGIMLPTLVDASTRNEQMYQQITLQNSSWYLYAGLIVNIIYLMAGIFYLLQKAFSKKLMYTALFVSLLFSVVSIFVHYLQAGDSILYWGSYFSYLVSILIDLIILMGVIKVAKNIVNNNQVIAYETNNNNQTSKYLKISSIAGLVAVSVPVIILGLWIYASSHGTSHQESQAIYKSYFPTFLHQRFYPTYLSMLFGFFTYLLVFQGLKLSSIFWKVLNIMVLIICSLLMMFNLWTMM